MKIKARGKTLRMITEMPLDMFNIGIIDSALSRHGFEYVRSMGLGLDHTTDQVELQIHVDDLVELLKKS